MLYRRTISIQGMAFLTPNFHHLKHTQLQRQIDINVKLYKKKTNTFNFALTELGRTLCSLPSVTTTQQSA